MLYIPEKAKKDSRIAFRTPLVVKKTLEFLAQKNLRSENQEAENLLFQKLREIASEQTRVFLLFRIVFPLNFFEIVKVQQILWQDLDLTEEVDRGIKDSIEFEYDSLSEELKKDGGVYSCFISYILPPEMHPLDWTPPYEDSIPDVIFYFLKTFNINPFGLSPNLYCFDLYIDKLISKSDIFFLTKIENKKNNLIRFDLSLQDLFGPHLPISWLESTLEKLEKLFVEKNRI